MAIVNCTSARPPGFAVITNIPKPADAAGAEAVGADSFAITLRKSSQHLPQPGSWNRFALERLQNHVGTAVSSHRARKNVGLQPRALHPMRKFQGRLIRA